MAFRSKTEAYSYVILILTFLKKEEEIYYKNNNRLEAINNCLSKVKISMENHEQDQNVVIKALSEVKSLLLPMSQEIINKIQYNMKNSSYIQSQEEKFENPLARRIESEIAITLLQNPTEAMMISVGRVSQEILKLIEDTGDPIKEFLKYFTESNNVIAFGSYKEEPSIEDIKEILKENNPAKLTEIMHIHFKFAKDITRELPIKSAPKRYPTGQLEKIVKKIYPYNPTYFFSNGIAEKERGIRAFIADMEMYKSPLFTAFPGRGRKGVLIDTPTNESGLMLKTQSEHAINLPLYGSLWSPDCKGQSADLASPYVRDLIENDSVYISGPSGMTGLLTAQMEILANFENEDLKKNYLTAITSYIVGGGFHSIHEVLGPAQYSLNLIPGYNIQIPEANKTAKPPNYNQFFKQQSSIDDEFNDRYEEAWKKYLNYFNNHYGPKYIEEFNPIDSIKKNELRKTSVMQSYNKNKSNYSN